MMPMKSLAFAALAQIATAQVWLGMSYLAYPLNPRKFRTSLTYLDSWR
jgi:hypothetical protein